GPCADPANKNQDEEADETPGAHAKRKDDAEPADDASDATQGDPEAAEANNTAGAEQTETAVLEEVLPVTGTKGQGSPDRAPATVAEGDGEAHKDAEQERGVPSEGAGVEDEVGDGSSGGDGTR
ncbi:unnamed protein product, partial [Ectocarpus sp. 12 AP-2014]